VLIGPVYSLVVVWFYVPVMEPHADEPNAVPKPSSLSGSCVGLARGSITDRTKQERYYRHTGWNKMQKLVNLLTKV